MSSTPSPGSTPPPEYPEDRRPEQGGEPLSRTTQSKSTSGRISVSTPDISPRVSYVLLGVTISMYLLQFASQNMTGIDYPAALGAKINEAIIQGQLWRLITPVLLHGSIIHLGFNMYALFVLGPGLERYYGHWRFLTLYLLAGFAGNVMSFLFTPAPSLGSSTAIFGLLGAQGIFLYQNREIFGRPVQRALMNLVMIALVNLFIGLSPGIDNWGHIGGLLAGTLFAWYAGPVLKMTGLYPNLKLVDVRERNDVIRTAVSVFILFGTLAGVTIFLRR